VPDGRAARGSSAVKPAAVRQCKSAAAAEFAGQIQLQQQQQQHATGAGPLPGNSSCGLLLPDAQSKQGSFAASCSVVSSGSRDEAGTYAVPQLQFSDCSDCSSFHTMLLFATEEFL
jgi:hypothetical protein